jgi:hypothetical protein
MFDPPPFNGTSPRHHKAGIEVEGLQIHDDDLGLVFEATIRVRGGRPGLRSLTIITTREQQTIDAATMRRIPVQRIAAEVAKHLAEMKALHAGEADSIRARIPSGPPNNEQVETDKAEAEAEGVSPRQFMAKKYGVTAWAADKWLARAKEAARARAETEAKAKTKPTPKSKD